MSIAHHIEADSLCFNFEAGTTSEEIFAAVHAAYADPECTPDLNLLFDFSASTSLANRSIAGIRTLSQFMLAHPGRPGRRIALIMAQAEAERLAGVASEYIEETGLDIRTFDSATAAHVWLSSD